MSVLAGDASLHTGSTVGKPSRGAKPKIDDSAALPLYRKGLSDAAIAGRLGFTRKGIAQWRKRRGLPSHNPQFNNRDPSLDKEKDRVLAMCRRGANNNEIAEAMGCGRNAVIRFRRRLGLGPSTATRRFSSSVAVNPILRDPLMARIASALGRSLSPDLLDDAMQDIAVAVLTGEIGEDEIEAKARRYSGRVIGQYASRFSKTDSLDEDLYEDFNRYSVIEDESQYADMRLVELSCLASRLGHDVGAIIGADA